MVLVCPMIMLSNVMREILSQMMVLEMMKAITVGSWGEIIEKIKLLEMSR